MHKTFIRNDIEVRVFAAPKALEPETRKQYEELSLTSAEVNAVKASRIARTAKRAAAALALCTSASAFAGSVAGFGGATEITQLLNNAELVSSVAQQAQMVEQNIQAQITRLQNLAQVPGELINETIAPYTQQLDNFRSLYSAVTDLQQAAQSTSQLFSNAMSDMSSANLKPSQWLSALSSLAKSQGGVYRAQLNQDLNAISSLAKRAQNLQSIQSKIPGVTGNVQGLQMLNQQTNVLAGEMIDLHALMQRQVAMQMQDKADQSQHRDNVAQLLKARSAQAADINTKEQTMIQNAPAFQLPRDQ
jgi:P-type conjugative transfer protein TrbJ